MRRTRQFVIGKNRKLLANETGARQDEEGTYSTGMFIKGIWICSLREGKRLAAT